MDKFEKLVNQIMKECAEDGEPVTREEAEEMAKMEIGAKGMKVGARAELPKKESEKEKKPRTVKISDEKVELFQSILENLTRCVPVERENIRILKENKLIVVEINDKIFKIDIIQQRNPKN